LAEQCGLVANQRFCELFVNFCEVVADRVGFTPGVEVDFEAEFLVGMGGFEPPTT
jgi:hypothetical protein